MKQGIVAVLVAIGLLAAGSASAHTTQFESAVIVLQGGFGKGGFAEALGFAGSKENPKCVSNRKVKLRVFGESLPGLTIDSATTSQQGGFYMFGDVPKGYNTLIVKMAKKNIGKHGHKHICSGDTDFVDGPE